MKTTLTPEQSATLIAKGISAEKASEAITTMQVACGCRGIVKLPKARPIFTLADVCSLLPKAIGNFTLDISTSSDGTWSAAYELHDNDDDWWSVVRDVQYCYVKTELIDALFDVLCELIDNGHIDFTK